MGMKIELQKSEIRILINALKVLRAHQGRAAEALKGLMGKNNSQVAYGLRLVDNLREKLERLVDHE